MSQKSAVQRAIDEYTAERDLLDRLIAKLQAVQQTKPKASRKPRTPKDTRVDA